MRKGFQTIPWLGFLAVAAVLVTPTPLHAQGWHPDRPIKVIVPFAPGGAVDLTARLVSEAMAKSLGVPMVVENRAGGSGVPAAEALVRSPPDGHTLSVVSSNYLTNGVLQTNLRFDVVKDITPISKMVVNTVMILVPQESPIRTLADLIAQAKARPATLTYGSVGHGSAMHFAGELLKSRANIDIVHVPYRGAGPALNDLLGNHMALAIIGIGPTIQHIRSGRLRAIAITTEKRSAILPDIPTVAELGYPGYYFSEWFAMIAPKGLPPEVRGRLHAAYVEAIRSADVKGALERVGLEGTSSTPEELAAFMAKELEHIRVIATQANIQAAKDSN